MAAARLLELTARTVYRAPERVVLHPGQWAVLRYLAGAGVRARTVNGVAAFLQTTHATASRAVRALERKGLVTRVPNPDDGRSQILNVTDEAKGLLDDDPVHTLAEGIEKLPPELREALVAALQHVYDHVRSTPPDTDAS
jgi:DNA-binding MarR family transcriptional regulator